jgi:hypothetical protein
LGRIRSQYLRHDSPAVVSNNDVQRLSAALLSSGYSKYLEMSHATANVRIDAKTNLATQAGSINDARLIDTVCNLVGRKVENIERVGNGA